MNFVDAACSQCGNPTVYTQELPILCKDCRITKNQHINKSMPRLLKEHGILGMLINNTLIDQQVNQ